MSFAFTALDMASLNQDQKSAIMEALVIAVVADGRAVEAETAQFDREVEAIDWGMDRATLIEQVTAARKKVMAIEGTEQGIVIITDVARRLDVPAIREKTFRAMAAVMAADGDMSRPELSVLAGFATKFELPRDRFELIKADVEAQH